eukprot:GCRY01003399.1.p1 GENE.GCRY01003399.1~~GCRY01003399.1.p1  ORF type:complete len:115 (-),score=29.46 GCRY01003399.1:143-487(-)
MEEYEKMDPYPGSENLPPSVNLEMHCDDPQNYTFTFTDEDHTLGNMLRYTLMKSPDVTFSGYTVPHPTESKMNLRVQTKDHVEAPKALHEACAAVTEACDHFLTVFDKAVENAS